MPPAHADVVSILLLSSPSLCISIYTVDHYNRKQQMLNSITVVATHFMTLIVK